MAALGDILYRGAAVWARLAGNTVASRKFLSQTGTGAVSAAPDWQRIVESDIDLSANTTNNVNVTRHGFTPVLPNDATKYLDGTGNYTVPTGTGGSGAPFVLSGSGNPQGGVSAAVGNLYMDTATGWWYIKRGGGSTAFGWYYLGGVGPLSVYGPSCYEIIGGDSSNGSPLLFGLNATSQTNNQSAVALADGFYNRSVTNSSAGVRGGWETAQFPPWWDNDFDLSFLIRTSSTITDARFWLGMVDGSVTNSDTLPSKGIAIRYSDGVDSNWVGITRDGTTQNVTSSLGSIAVDSKYILRIRFVRSGTPTVYFSINDGTEVSTTSNIPATGSQCNILLYVYNKVATAQTLYFRRAGITAGS